MNIKILFSLCFLSISSLILAQDPSYNTLTLTKAYDQLKFQIPGEHRYFFMSKPSTNTSFGLYSPDDGGWFTYWNTGSGNMILNKGKIGVGNSTPFYPIHIKTPSGTNAIFGLEATNFTPQIRMYSGGTNIHNRIAYGTGTGTDGKFSISEISTGSGVNGSITDRLTINSNGYVGIGVNPTYKLDVNGSAKIRSSMVVDGTDFSLGRNNSRDVGSLVNQEPWFTIHKTGYL